MELYLNFCCYLSLVESEDELYVVRLYDTRQSTRVAHLETCTSCDGNCMKKSWHLFKLYFIKMYNDFDLTGGQS